MTAKLKSIHTIGRVEHNHRQTKQTARMQNINNQTKNSNSHHLKSWWWRQLILSRASFIDSLLENKTVFYHADNLWWYFDILTPRQRTDWPCSQRRWSSIKWPTIEERPNPNTTRCPTELSKFLRYLLFDVVVVLLRKLIFYWNNFIHDKRLRWRFLHHHRAP